MSHRAVAKMHRNDRKNRLHLWPKPVSLTTMPEPRTCSKCGAALPAEGACPRCLLQFGIDLPDETVLQPAPAAPEQPGDRIGRYKLLQQIGEGGCGVVYMA